MTTPDLSPSAWAVLRQLAYGPAGDGNIVSKEGRTELVEKGLARRTSQVGSEFAANSLTEAGLQLAAQMHATSGRHQ